MPVLLPHHARRRAAGLVAVVALLGGCDARGDLPEADLGAASEATTVVTDASVLVDGGWPEAADYVARATADGHPVLVNAFASWCEPCREELPEIVALAADNPDLRVLGIDHQDDRDDGAAMVDEFGITYPTIFDRTGDVVITLQQAGMPVTVLFDADGNVVRARAAQLTRAELDAWVAEVLPS